MRELIPRQADKKAEVPKEEKGLSLLKQRKGSGILKEKERTNIFFFFSPSTLLSLSHIKHFCFVLFCFVFKPRPDDYTTELSLNSVLRIGGSDGKVSVYNAGDLGSIPGSGRFPGEGNGNPLQYYCLENPMDKGAW